jgi:opacity protein-like surface antigen
MRGTALALLTAGGLGLGLMPATVSAQAADWAQGWSGQATLYGWLPTVTGAQERRDGRPLVDLDASDVLSALDLAFMGAAEIRNGKFGLLVDLVYADLSQDGKGLFPDRANAIRTEVGTKLTMFTLASSYRAYEAERSFVDVYAGARWYDVDLSFDARNNRFRFSRDTSVDWVDPIVGIRGAVPLSERWTVSGFADVGGFDGSSDLSWEVYGGANYAFTERWAGTVGYRYMSILYEAEKATLDIEVLGPVLGVTYKF